MARKRPNSKGKSKRRVKHWTSQYTEGHDLDRHNLPQTYSKTGIKLREDAAADAAYDPEDCFRGMVAGVFRRGIFVRPDGSNEMRFCGIAKTFRPPEDFGHTSAITVGDFVIVARPDEKYSSGQLQLDRNRSEGVILSREARTSVLSRPAPRSEKRNDEYASQPAQEKVIAANMDTLLIVVAVAQPAMRRELVERFLIAAERGGLQPILAVNKIDLGDPPADWIADWTARGVKIVMMSAATGEGTAELLHMLEGHRAVLAGASGVGKSTFVNAVIPEAQAATREVRGKDDRGRHTTSQSRMYDVPGDGLLVDTPGIRELGVNIPLEQVGWYFPEFEPFAQQCKFRNCTHIHEPNCQVQAAVENGDLPAHRFQSYLRLRQTLEGKSF